MTQLTAVITVCLNPAIDCILETPGLVLGAHVQGRLLLRQPAGKAINVSLALARLGRSNIATGFVGSGELDEFRQGLDRPGPGRIACELIPVAAQTRQSITLLDPLGPSDTHVRVTGFQVGPDDIDRLTNRLADLSGPDRLTVFSGSLPPGMTPDHFAQLILTATATGGKAALDLPGNLLRDVLARNLAGVCLLKPNRAEMTEALAATAPLDEAALIGHARRLAQHILWVAVTFGSDGALLVGSGQTLRGQIPIDPRRIVDTVGCGDCFLAGLIDAYLSDLPPSVMLQRALAAATANACAVGAANFDTDTLTALENVASISLLTSFDK